MLQLGVPIWMRLAGGLVPCQEGRPVGFQPCAKDGGSHQLFLDSRMVFVPLDCRGPDVQFAKGTCPATPSIERPSRIRR